jgi:hypothetical protein
MHYSLEMELLFKMYLILYVAKHNANDKSALMTMKIDFLFGHWTLFQPLSLVFSGT